MKKIGTFRIEESFYIPDQGIIVLCQIIEGIARVGSSTKIEFAGTYISAIIVGVHMPSLGEDEIFRTAFLLKFEDSTITKKIASEKLIQQTIEVFVET